MKALPRIDPRRAGALIGGTIAAATAALVCNLACIQEPEYEGRRCFVNDPCPQGYACAADERCHKGAIDAGPARDAGSEPDAGIFDHARCADPFHYPARGWEVRHYRLPSDYRIYEQNCIGLEDLSTAEIHRDYGFGGLGPDAILFVSRYTAKRVFTPSSMMFTVRHDDGLRIFVDDHLIYENWIHVVSNPKTATTAYLPAGEHRLEVQHNNLAGAAYVDVGYGPACSIVDRRSNRWALAYHRLAPDQTIDRQDCFGAELLAEDHIRFAWGDRPPAYVERAGAPNRFALIGHTRRLFNGRTQITFNHGGALRFTLDGNDTIYESLAPSPARSATVTADLSGLHDLELELVHTEGPALLSIHW